MGWVKFHVQKIEIICGEPMKKLSITDDYYLVGLFKDRQKKEPSTDESVVRIKTSTKG